MTIADAKEINKGKYNTVEVYKNINQISKDFHTDNIEFTEEYTGNTEIIDYNLMDKEEYNNTVLANHDLYADDFMSESDFPVLCILVEHFD